MTEQEATHLREYDLVIGNSNIPKGRVASFTCGKVYVIGGRYFFNGDTLVSIISNDKGYPDGWLSEYFDKLPYSPMLKILYGIENENR